MEDTMAGLQFLGIFIILVVCWSWEYVDGQGGGVWFSLRGTSYQNNSLVNLEEIGEGLDAALLCVTDNTACCGRAQVPGGGVLGNWYYPNGTGVVNMGDVWEFYRLRDQSVVYMNRRRGGLNGIYRCEIPDTTGVNQTIYIGVYSASTGVPSVNNLTFNGSSNTLTCTSTGGPATNVTWRRNGVVIILNATHQQTQIVTNTTNGTYQTVLTIDSSVSQSDVGTYKCTVENVRGRSSVTVVVGEGVWFSLRGTTYQNNSLVNLEDIGEGLDAALLCVTDNTACCGRAQVPGGGVLGNWYYPNGTGVVNMGEMWEFYRLRDQSVVYMNRRRGGLDGIYRCVIPDTTGVDQTIYIGVYSASIGVPSVNNLTFNGSSNTLTCTSTGGPATNVTWRRNGVVITLNATNQQTQIVTNTTNGTYQTVLTIDSSVSQSDIVGTYNCAVENVRGRSSLTVVVVPPPTVTVGVSTHGAVTYAGNNVTLNCGITLLGGVTDSDVTVSSMWTKNGAPFTGISGRVTVSNQQRLTSTIFTRQLIFSPLSSSMDNGTYACVVTLTPSRPQFVNAVSRSQSISLAVQVPTIIATFTTNTTRLPNVAPYNTFSLNCTATSSVEGVGNVTLPKRFLWLRRYGSSEFNLVPLTSNATIQIQDEDNLNQPTSSSMLTVTEDIPQDYRYRCQIDLNLTADMILNRADVYPITVLGPSSPLQPSNLTSTGVTHNTATIFWTVSRIAYTPETYTVHFGTSPGSLTSFNQQRQSGNNFTATNLQFSLQLTGLSAGTTYYYQVVAVNSVRSTASVELSFMTTTLSPEPPQMFQISSVTTTNINFSWQAPAVTNGALTGYQLSCQPELPVGIPSPPTLSLGPTVNTAVLPNLFPGVRYNCRIMANNSAGLSDPVYAVDTTAETAPTGPPQSFTVTQRSARNVTFSWSPPAPTLRNGVITTYSLSCVPEAAAHGRDTISMQYTAAGTFTLGGFTPATSYNCSIFARNSPGSGPTTYLINTTLEAPPDAPPQNFMFSLMYDIPEMVDFFWEPPPLDRQNGIIIGYNIICISSGGGQPVNFVVTDDGMSGTLNATVGMFIPATQYFCAITAFTSAGPGTAETRDVITLPASPENVALTTTFSPLRVTWTIDPPDGLVSNYTIYVTRLERGSTVVNYTSANTQLLQYDIPNLDPYELVEVSVSASNSAGEGPRTTGVRGRTREEPPGIVSNCPSRWTDLANAIQVTWTAPERPNGMLLRYHIQLTTYDGRRVITTESVGSGTLVGQLDTSELEDGVPYIVSIFAENSAGNGTKCNVTDFTNELPPPAPRNVMVAHVSGTIVRVSWQPLSPVEARGHITYRVMVTPTTGSRRRRQATQGERVCTLLSPCEVPANESSVIVVGLDRNTSYSVTVMAVNSEGEDGPTSMPIAATIPTVPPTQMGVNIGTVVGVVVALVVVIIIMGVVIGVQMARNRRYRLTVQQHAVKDEPVKWSEVAGSSDTTIITTQYEAYATVDQGHEYEVLEHTAQRPPGPGYEIPVTKCPAYVPTSEQEGQRVEEAVYEL